ncbi:hypothetical protein ACF0H5_006184 [Mactra antiquata]
MVSKEMNCSMNTGTVDQHICGMCGESSSSLMNFLKHKIKHVDRGSGIGCEICQISFSRQGPLLDHYRRKHHINLAEKSHDGSTVNNYLKSKKKTSRTTPIGHRTDVITNDGHRNSDIYNNVKVTRLTISPKGELVITKQLDNLQSSASVIAEKITECGVNEMNDKSSYSVEMLNTLPRVSEGLSKVREAVNLPSNDYGMEDTIQYDMTTVSDCKDVAEDIDDNNCDDGNDNNDENNGDVIFTQQKLEWCDQIKGQRPVTVNSEPVKIDFVLNCNPITTGNQSYTNSVNTTVLVDIDRSAGDDHHQHIPHLADNHDGNNVSTTVLEDTGRQTGDDLHQITQQAENHDDVSNFVCTSVSTDVNMITNIDSIGQDTCVRTSGKQSVNKRKTSLQTRIKRPKLTQIPGKIPQELNMSDFYFLKLTAKSGHNNARCSGKDVFQCLFCEKTMKWRSDMCRHMRQYHVEKLDSGKALKSPDGLQCANGIVMKMTDYIELENVLKPNKRKRGIETQDLPGDFECEVCGKVFHKLRNLRFHRHVHETGNEYLCSICSKLLKTKAIFERHLKTHQEKQTYKCTQCDFESSVNIAIHRHRQIHNSDSHLCETCGLAYKDKSTLSKHKKVHDLSRPFACTHPGCSWRFMTEVMCNAHIRSHSSKRKYKCTMCGYAFFQKHHLQRHEKIVHNIVHKTKSDYDSYNWKIDSNSESELNNDIKDANSLEVSHEVNLIINESNIPGVMSTEHFDLETALQSGQLVIANDDGTSVNYEMSDLGSNIVYQTLLHDGVGQQFETQTVCIAPNDSGEVNFHEVNSVQAEVEIEQS